MELIQENTEAACAAHPNQKAVAECASCRKALCEICVFAVGNQAFCGDCGIAAARAAAAKPAAEARPVLTSAFPSSASAAVDQNFHPRVPTGLKCVQHNGVDAVAQCNACSSGMCATCDFEMPTGMHFCPACIDNASSAEISPKRRTMAIAAIVIAVYCTVLFVLMITGALYRAAGRPSDVQTFGCLVIVILYAPSIIGTAIATTAFNRRLRNTAAIWIALVWNSVITGFLVLQLILGMLRK